MFTTIRFPKRWLAAFTAFLMLVNSLFLPHGFAEPAQPAAVSVSTPLKTLNDLKLPPTLAAVSDIYQGKSKHWVLLLQDAHAQPDAQKKIAHLIMKLSEKYGIRDVLVEGGTGEADGFLFRNYPEREKLKQIFGRMMDRGELSGSMSALVLSHDSLRMRGVEDPGLYENQLLAYLRGNSESGDLKALIQKKQQALKSEKKTIYAPELLNLESQLEVFEEKEQGLESSLEALARIREPAEYPLVLLVLNQIRQGKGVERFQAEAEIVKMFDEFESRFQSPEDRALLNQTRQDFQTGQTDAAAAAETLLASAGKKKQDLRCGNKIRIWLKHRRELAGMKAGDFMHQWETYRAEVETGLLKTEEARKLYEEDRQWKLLEKMTAFKARRDEWKEIQKLYRSKQSLFDVFKTPEEKKLLKAFFDFYDLSEKREENFDAEIKKAFAEERGDSPGIIFLAGGFHTEGMRARLREQGISFAVLTPAFKPAADAEKFYADTMRGEVSWKKFLLEDGKITDVKSAFTRALMEDLTASENTAVSSSSAASNLKRWRDGVIRELAAEGRLQQAGQYTKWIDRSAEQWSRHSKRSEDKEAISLKTERFLSGMKLLLESGNFTREKVTELFVTPAVSGALDKPFVAIPISQALNTAMRSEVKAVPFRGVDSRAEIRTLENYEGYQELKPGIETLLGMMHDRYFLTDAMLRPFSILKADELSQGAPVSLNEAGVVLIREDFIRLARNDEIARRVLAREMARFAQERFAAASRIDPQHLTLIGIREDLARFLRQTPEERIQDLRFYQEHPELFPGLDLSRYQAAHEAVAAKEAVIQDVEGFKKFREREKAVALAVQGLTQSQADAGYVVSEKDFLSRQLQSQAEAFHRKDFFPRLTQRNAPLFWKYASLDMVRHLVLEASHYEVSQERRQSERESIARKLGKNPEEIQQPMLFIIQPWQLDVQDLHAFLPGLFDFLTTGVSVPAAFSHHTTRDQSVNLFLETLGWPPRMFDAARQTEAERVEAVIGLIDFLAGDMADPDEKPGHRWSSDSMSFTETEPIPVADLPEAGLLTSYWITNEGKRSQPSRYGYLGAEDLRFTTGDLTSDSVKFFKMVQLASLVRVLRARGGQPFEAFEGIPVGANDMETAENIARVLNDKSSAGQPAKIELKQKIARDPDLSTQVIFADEMQNRASTGFFRTNLEEIYAFQEILDDLLPSAEKIKNEKARSRQDYSTVTEKQALARGGLLGLRLKRLEDSLSAQKRIYGRLPNGDPAVYFRDGKPQLAVLVNEAGEVNGILVYHYGEDGKVLYEDHRRILTPEAFSADRDLAYWESREGTLFNADITQRLFYENGEPVLRIQVETKTGQPAIITAIEGLQGSALSAAPSGFQYLENIKAQPHVLLAADYPFDSSLRTASDWLKRQTEIETVELPEPSAEANRRVLTKKIGGETIIDTSIHWKKQNGDSFVTGIEQHSSNAGDVFGDFLQLPENSLPYDSKKTLTKWEAMYADTPTADRPVGKKVTKRIYYDAAYFEDENNKDPFRPVMEIEVDSDNKAKTITSFGYGPEGELIYRESRDVTGQVFEDGKSLEAWKTAPVLKKTFLDEAGQPVLEIEWAAENPAKINAVMEFRKKGRGRQYMKMIYPAAAPEEISSQPYQGWTVEEWKVFLKRYELLDAYDLAGLGPAAGKFDHDRQLMTDGDASQQGYLEKTGFSAVRIFFNQMLELAFKLQRGEEVHASEEQIEELDDFVQMVLRPMLGTWGIDMEEMPRDFSRIVRRTAVLAEHYASDLNITGIPLAMARVQRSIFSKDLWTEQERFDAAETLLHQGTPQNPKLSGAGTYFSPLLKTLLSDYADRVSPIAAFQEAALKRYGVSASRYYGNFEELLDGSPAQQGALWAVRYLQENYGRELEEGEFKESVENDSLSLVFRAQKIAGGTVAHQLTDIQADPETNRISGYDRKKTPLRWNSNRSETALSTSAAEAPHTHDLVMEVYSLSGQRGAASREAVAQKLTDANQTLSQDGLLVLMLPANKGWSEEGIERMEAEYGFRRLEEGIAYHELSSDYRARQMGAEGDGAEARMEEMLRAEEALESQKFYVLILQKTADIPAGDHRSRENLEIKTFGTAIDPAPVETVKVRNDGGQLEVRLSPRRDATAVLKKHRPEAWRAAKPQTRIGRKIKRTGVAARSRKIDFPELDRKDFPQVLSRLAVLQRYARLLIGRENPSYPADKRSRVRNLLNRTHTARVETDKADQNVLNRAWKHKEDLWWTDETVPAAGKWPAQNTVISNDGLAAVVIAHEAGKVTAVWVQERDSAGHVLYSSPRKVLDKTFAFDPALDFSGWRALQGTVYSGEEDLGELLARQRNVYLPVFQSYDDLMEFYPALKKYPELDSWFQDDVWNSLKAVIQEDFEGHPLQEIFAPITQNRDFLLEMEQVWKHLDRRITLQEAEKLWMLRFMVKRILRSRKFVAAKRWGKRAPSRGGTFRPDAEKEEARIISQTLRSNVSFVGASAIAKVVENNRQQKAAGEPFVMLDGGAGTGAVAHALAVLGMNPAEDEQFHFYETDPSQESLDQPRPAGFSGERYHQDKKSLGELDQPDHFFDQVTLSYVAHLLTAEQARDLYAGLNRIVKSGGEVTLALPQSWRFSQEYLQALSQLGWELAEAPRRLGEQASEEWIQSIRDHYGNTDEGDAIAEKVRQIKSRQFTLLRIRKTRNLGADEAAAIDPKVFELEKTETGQQAKGTGEKEFDFGPEALEKWIEVETWTLQDWTEDEVTSENPLNGTADREEILRIFPEIELEGALDVLYKYRFLFSSQQDSGNPYETISDFYTYWNSGVQVFHRRTAEDLARFYREGPAPNRLAPPQSMKAERVSGRLRSRAKIFHIMNRNRDASYPFFDRNRELIQQIETLIAETEKHLGRFQQAGPMAVLAIPSDQRERFGFWRAFKYLIEGYLQGRAVWSPRNLAALDWFMKSIYTEQKASGINAMAELLQNPPDIPTDLLNLTTGTGAVGAAFSSRSETQTEEIPDIAQQSINEAMEYSIHTVMDEEALPFNEFPSFQQIMRFQQKEGFSAATSDLSERQRAVLTKTQKKIYEWQRYYHALQNSFRALGQAISGFSEMPLEGINPWGFDTALKLPDRYQLLDAVHHGKTETSEITEIHMFDLGAVDQPFIKTPQNKSLNVTAGLLVGHKARKPLPQLRNTKLRIAYLFPPKRLPDLKSPFISETFGDVDFLDMEQLIDGIPGDTPLDASRKTALKQWLSFMREPVTEETREAKMALLEKLGKAFLYDRGLAAEVVFMKQAAPEDHDGIQGLEADSRRISADLYEKVPLLIRGESVEELQVTARSRSIRISPQMSQSWEGRYSGKVWDYQLRQPVTRLNFDLRVENPALSSIEAVFENPKGSSQRKTNQEFLAWKKAQEDPEETETRHEAREIDVNSPWAEMLENAKEDGMDQEKLLKVSVHLAQTFRKQAEAKKISWDAFHGAMKTLRETGGDAFLKMDAKTYGFSQKFPADALEATEALEGYDTWAMPQADIDFVNLKVKQWLDSGAEPASPLLKELEAWTGNPGEGLTERIRYFNRIGLLFITKKMLLYGHPYDFEIFQKALSHVKLSVTSDSDIILRFKALEGLSRDGRFSTGHQLQALGLTLNTVSMQLPYLKKNIASTFSVEAVMKLSAYYGAGFEDQPEIEPDVESEALASELQNISTIKDLFWFFAAAHENDLKGPNLILLNQKLMEMLLASRENREEFLNLIAEKHTVMAITSSLMNEALLMEGTEELLETSKQAFMLLGREAVERNRAYEIFGISAFISLPQTRKKTAPAFVPVRDEIMWNLFVKDTGYGVAAAEGYASPSVKTDGSHIEKTSAALDLNHIASVLGERLKEGGTFEQKAMAHHMLDFVAYLAKTDSAQRQGSHQLLDSILSDDPLAAFTSPVDAANYLKDKQIWKISDSDLEESAKLVKHVFDAVPGEREPRFQEVEAWIDAAVEEGSLPGKSLSRLYAVYAKFKSESERRTDMPLAEIHATNNRLLDLFKARVPYYQTDSSAALKVAELQLLVQASLDPRLPASERMRLYAWGQQEFIDNASFNKAFADQAGRVAPGSPLHRMPLPLTYDRKSTDEEKNKVPEIESLFTFKKKGNFYVDAAKAREAFKKLSLLELRLALSSIGPSLERKLKGKEFETAYANFMKELMIEVDSRPNPMETLLALIAILRNANVPLLSGKYMEPLAAKLEELLQNERHAKDFLRLAGEGSPRLTIYFAQGLPRLAYSIALNGRSTPGYARSLFHPGGVLETFLTKAMKDAFEAGDMPRLLQLSRILSMFSEDASRHGGLPYDEARLMGWHMLKSFNQDALTNPEGTQIVSEFVSGANAMQTAELLGSMVHEMAQAGDPQIETRRRRALHLIDLVVATHNEGSEEEREKLVNRFERMAEGQEPLPRDAVAAVKYLADKKVWQVSDEEIAEAERLTQAYAAAPESSRAEASSAMEKWVDEVWLEGEASYPGLNRQGITRILLLKTKLKKAIRENQDMDFDTIMKTRMPAPLLLRLPFVRKSESETALQIQLEVEASRDARLRPAERFDLFQSSNKLMGADTPFFEKISVKPDVSIPLQSPFRYFRSDLQDSLSSKQTAELQDALRALRDQPNADEATMKSVLQTLHDPKQVQAFLKSKSVLEVKGKSKSREYYRRLMIAVTEQMLAVSSTRIEGYLRLVYTTGQDNSGDTSYALPLYESLKTYLQTEEGQKAFLETLQDQMPAASYWAYAITHSPTNIILGRGEENQWIEDILTSGMNKAIETDNFQLLMGIFRLVNTLTAIQNEPNKSFTELFTFKLNQILMDAIVRGSERGWFTQFSADFNPAGFAQTLGSAVFILKAEEPDQEPSFRKHAIHFLDLLVAETISKEGPDDHKKRDAVVSLFNKASKGLMGTKPLQRDFAQAVAQLNPYKNLWTPDEEDFEMAELLATALLNADNTGQRQLAFGAVKKWIAGEGEDLLQNFRLTRNYLFYAKLKNMGEAGTLIAEKWQPVFELTKQLYPEFTPGQESARLLSAQILIEASRDERLSYEERMYLLTFANDVYDPISSKFAAGTGLRMADDHPLSYFMPLQTESSSDDVSGIINAYRNENRSEELNRLSSAGKQQIIRQWPVQSAAGTSREAVLKLNDDTRRLTEDLASGLRSIHELHLLIRTMLEVNNTIFTGTNLAPFIRKLDSMLGDEKGRSEFYEELTRSDSFMRSLNFIFGMSAYSMQLKAAGYSATKGYRVFELGAHLNLESTFDQGLQQGNPFVVHAIAKLAYMYRFAISRMPPPAFAEAEKDAGEFFFRIYYFLLDQILQGTGKEHWIVDWLAFSPYTVTEEDFPRHLALRVKRLPAPERDAAIKRGIKLVGAMALAKKLAPAAAAKMRSTFETEARLAGSPSGDPFSEVRGVIDRMVSANLTQTARHEAEAQLMFYIKAQGISQQETWRRKLLAEMYWKHKSRSGEVSYELIKSAYDFFQSHIVESPERLSLNQLEAYYEFMGNFISSGTWDFTQQTLLYSRLENIETHLFNNQVMEQPLFQARLDRFPFQRFRKISSPQDGSPEIHSVGDFIRLADPKRFFSLRTTEAKSFLESTEKLLASLDARRELAVQIKNSVYVKAMVSVLLQKGYSPAEMPNIKKLLIEMFVSKDFGQAAAVLSIHIWGRDESLFKTILAEIFEQPGASYDFRNVIASLFALRPKLYEQDADVFLSAVEDALAQAVKKQGGNIDPKIPEMLAHQVMLLYAASENFQEPAVRALLQLAPGEPWANNRFQRVLDAAPKQRLLAIRPPDGAPHQAAHDTIGKQLWEMSPEQKAVIESYVIRMQANRASQDQFLQALDEFIQYASAESAGQYQSWSAWIYAMALFQEKILSENIPFETADQRWEPFFDRAFQGVRAREDSQRLQIYQLVSQAAQDQTLSPYVRRTIAKNLLKIAPEIAQSANRTPALGEWLELVPESEPLGGLAHRLWRRSRSEKEKPIAFDQIQDIDQLVGILTDAIHPANSRTDVSAAMTRFDQLLGDPAQKEKYLKMMEFSVPAPQVFTFFLRNVPAGTKGPRLLNFEKVLREIFASPKSPQMEGLALNAWGLYWRGYLQEDVSRNPEIAEMLGQTEMTRDLTDYLDDVWGTVLKTAGAASDSAARERLFKNRITAAKETLSVLAGLRKTNPDLKVPNLFSLTRYFFYAAIRQGITEKAMRSALEVPEGEPLIHNLFAPILESMRAETPQSSNPLESKGADQNHWAFTEQDSLRAEQLITAVLQSEDADSQAVRELEDFVEGINENASQSQQWSRKTMVLPLLQAVAVEKDFPYEHLQRTLTLFRGNPHFKVDVNSVEESLGMLQLMQEASLDSNLKLNVRTALVGQAVFLYENISAGKFGAQLRQLVNTSPAKSPLGFYRTSTPQAPAVSPIAMPGNVLNWPDFENVEDFLNYFNTMPKSEMETRINLNQIKFINILNGFLADAEQRARLMKIMASRYYSPLEPLNAWFRAVKAMGQPESFNQDIARYIPGFAKELLLTQNPVLMYRAREIWAAQNAVFEKPPANATMLQLFYHQLSTLMGSYTVSFSEVSQIIQSFLLSFAHDPHDAKRSVQNRVDTLSIGLEKLLTRVKTSKDLRVPGSPDELTRLALLIGAQSGLNEEDMREILGVQPGQSILENRFREIYTRHENRQLEKTEISFLGGRSLAYLIAGRVPENAFLENLIGTVPGNFPAYEASVRASASDLFRTMKEMGRIPEWTDPVFEDIMNRTEENLRQQGLIAEVHPNADAVRIFKELPDTDALIAVMRRQTNFNLLGIWVGGSQVSADSMERQVNKALGSGDKPRFKLITADSENRLKQAISKAPSIMAQLKNRRDQTAIAKRITFIYEDGSVNESLFAEFKSLRHSLRSKDQNRFGKEYFLYQSAGEISEETLSRLPAFLTGEGAEDAQSRYQRYFFNDQKIPSEMIGALLVMRNLIAKQFAAAA